MNEWISVKDRLPKGSGHCLVFRSDNNLRQGFNYVIAIKSDVKILSNATHWQELPEPPKEL